MLTSTRWLIVGTFALLSVAMPAQAYVGPGAGITLIGALVGLVSAIGLAFFAVLRWPIRRFLARRKAAQAGTGASAANDPENGPQ